MTQILSEIDDGSCVEPSSMKLETWLDIWLKEYTANLKPTTYSCYESSVRVHLKPNLGRIQLSALAPHMIQHFYNELLNEKHLSPKTIKNINGAFHKALEQAKKLGYMGHASIETTRKYLHKDDEIEREAIATMSNMINMDTMTTAPNLNGARKKHKFANLPLPDFAKQSVIHPESA